MTGKAMHVTEATDNLQDAWDTFVLDSPLGSFLQSWAWGDFQRAAGFPVMRLAVVGGSDTQPPTPNTLAAVCLLVRRSLPFRAFWLYAPWGPVLMAADAGCAEGAQDALAALTAHLRGTLGSRGVFLRIESKLPASRDTQRIYMRLGFVFPGHGIQPKHTLVLNLAPSEDELLRGMHPKTRYNIRIARRQGVVVSDETNEGGLAKFLALAREVERQGRFHYHPEGYYRAMLRALGPRGMLTILIAAYKGMPLAAHLLVRFGGTVTYAHGASSNQRRSAMAPPLLQWDGILRAKAAGATRYDFFGIAPPGASATHPWYGITRFKRGFGGTEGHFFGAADLVGDMPYYRAYEIGRSLRTLLR